MRVRRVMAVLGVLGLIGAAVAVAATRLTAFKLRIADHPAYVRVVVDLSGGTAKTGEVEANTSRLFSHGTTSLTISHRRIRTTAPALTAAGVHASIAQGSGKITLRLTTARHRYKALQESAFGGPQRLAFDLYKAAPPSAAATIGRDGCLITDSFSITPGRAKMTGHLAQPIFENGLLLQVRNSRGAVVGHKPITANQSGHWAGSFRYRVTKAQQGTLEAVVLSAKDGSLDCINQTRASLRP